VVLLYGVVVTGRIDISQMSLGSAAVSLTAVSLYSAGAGVLAIARRVETPWLCVSLGVAFPVVVASMMRNVAGVRTKDLSK